MKLMKVTLVMVFIKFIQISYFQCITRNCKKCGMDGVLMNIIKENPGIMESSETVIDGNGGKINNLAHID